MQIHILTPVSAEANVPLNIITTIYASAHMSQQQTQESNIQVTCKKEGQRSRLQTAVLPGSPEGLAASWPRAPAGLRGGRAADSCLAARSAAHALMMIEWACTGVTATSLAVTSVLSTKHAGTCSMATHLVDTPFVSTKTVLAVTSAMTTTAVDRAPKGTTSVDAEARGTAAVAAAFRVTTAFTLTTMTVTAAEASLKGIGSTSAGKLVTVMEVCAAMQQRVGLEMRAEVVGLMVRVKAGARIRAVVA